MEERIIQLETLSVLQDETIKNLSQEVFRQQQDIARLCRGLVTLEEKLAKLQEADQIGGNEKPPHY